MNDGMQAGVYVQLEDGREKDAGIRIGTPDRAPPVKRSVESNEMKTDDEHSKVCQLLQ